MLKGLGYVREYHRMEDADYSAALFIRHYLSLCETCRSGEQEEQLSYAREAYHFAKQCLQKYQTEQMLGEYKFAVMALACHYRMDGQEGPAAKLGKEGRELAAKVEPKGMGFAKRKRPEGTESMESVSGTAFQGSPKIQGKNHVPEEESFSRWFVDTRCEILPRSEEIVGQHREDIYALIETCINLCSIAYCQGLAPLMQAAEPLSKSNMSGYKMLASGIKDFGEGNPQDLAERVLRRFPICREDGYTEFTQYLCIRFFLLLQCGAAGRAVETMLLSMIHPKEQNRLKNIWVKQRSGV